MPVPGPHRERHYARRSGWLRAAVLGANDGIVSTASLLVGVAAAAAPPDAVLTAGVAGLVAGAMSMATGEYVSVSSQADTERADLERERRELAADPEFEHAELAAIYVKRGLAAPLAGEVARALMAHDALAAHARDELGLSSARRARPLQAALASAATFAGGALIPLGAAALARPGMLLPAVASSALTALLITGSVAAHAGGAPRVRGALRVSFWGALAMAATAAAGMLFDAW